MNEILTLLGLPTNATKDKIAQAALDLKNESALIRSQFGLPDSATHADLIAAIAAFKKIPVSVASFDPKAIAAKRAAGLTQEQAIEVLKAQAEHDAALAEAELAKEAAALIPEEAPAPSANS